MGEMKGVEKSVKQKDQKRCCVHRDKEKDIWVWSKR